MSTVFTPIDHYITKFYLKEKDFKKFTEISEEQLSVISKKVYRKQETSNLAPTEKNINKLERYQKTMQYLTNPLIHLDLKTFDERIAYLIMMIDPNLIMFKEFLKLDLISIADINKIDNEDKRNYLKNIRKQTILNYESMIRQKIGFYDVKLLKYEELFFKRFFNEKELIKEIENNNQENIITKAKLLKNFNNITNERYKELISIAEIWLLLTPEKNNIKSAAYSVTSQKNYLD